MIIPGPKLRYKPRGMPVRRMRKWPLNHIHVIDTEVRTLDHALALIEFKQVGEKAAANRAKRSRTLREELGAAKNRARLLKMMGKVSLAPVQGITHSTVVYKPPWSKKKSEQSPHPFQSLKHDAKRKDAQERYASGYWGIGDRATRELAKAYGVSFLTMHVWLKDVKPEGGER